MLMEATKVKVCPEKDKIVILLIDEMDVREGIVYEKLTGRMIGFSNLGDVNNHLLQFEKDLHNTSTSMPNAVQLNKNPFTPPLTHPCFSASASNPSIYYL